MQIIKAKAEPTTPSSGYGTAYLDEADNKYKIKKDTGTVVDLETGGGGGITSVNGDVGPTVVLDTDDVSEGGTNLYYTAARFSTAFATKTTSDLAEGSNLYYTLARFNTALATKTTSDVAEGSNLYYTSARFDSAFATKSTDDLSEGSNLYFTVERAQDAVGANVQAPLSYDDPSGQISIPKADASTDGYLDKDDFIAFSSAGKYINQSTIGSPYSMNTNTDITPSTDFRQYWLLKSGGGALGITSDPQILPGAFVGQEILLQGTDDTDYPILNARQGLYLNGNCAMKNKTTLTVIWDGSVWVETSRNDI
jgi:hypothetical protein